ncbi:hypothetical protein JTI58_24400 [Lysinibacillus fusiformis]|uniref:hypothetical protein n=1 Tax=Lysinibacillus fusiformis TaxID=28031 RepID=UPI0019679C34|nr:hypothetical protein [Lysinibacillus fusiformis]QSB10073.1 hypothetical protein JTI58_24400 [Lysinibacillus fusiformis]
MEFSIGGIFGLYGGMICGILGWWFGRQKAKKNRGLDELYDHIWQKAKSYSWYMTLAAIYIFFSLMVFGIELNIAMVLGILLLVHIGSWGIIGIILTVNMYGPVPFKSSYVKIGISINVASLIIFTIISFITNNWRFLLISIIPNMVGIFTALIVSKKQSK